MITALLAGLKIQSDELSILQDTFTQLDQDKDGYISADDLRQNLFGVFNNYFVKDHQAQMDPTEFKRRKNVVESIIRKGDLN